jgi:hypothetical protein
MASQRKTDSLTHKLLQFVRQLYSLIFTIKVTIHIYKSDADPSEALLTLIIQHIEIPI